jgi:hypothetical protein
MTAVEILFTELLSSKGLSKVLQNRNNYLELEKAQIIKAFKEGSFADDEKIKAEEYYQKTYGKE